MIDETTEIDETAETTETTDESTESESPDSRRELIESLMSGADSGESAGGEGPIDGATEEPKGSPQQSDPPRHTEASPGQADPADSPESAPGIVPPDHWSDEDKNLFNQQSEEVKQYWIDRSSAMDAAHTQRSQQIAEERRQLEPIMGALNESMPYLNQIGIPPETAFRELVRTEQTLRMGTPGQKQAAIRQLMADYNISLPEGPAPSGESLAVGDDVTQVLESYIQPLHGQIGQMQQFLHAQSSAQRQSQEAALAQEIEDFKAQTGEDGQPSHPYFEHLEAEMTRLAQAEVAAGRTPTLAQLYERAAWSDPDTRAEMIAAQHEDAAAKAEAERQKRVEKAKRTRTTAPGVSAADAANPVQPDDRRAIIERLYEEAAAG